MIVHLILALVLIALAALAVGCRASEAGLHDPTRNVHQYTLTANDGSPYPLAQHRGRLLLLVNTASRCGFTRQYAGLQELHRDFAGRGLVVIGVPSNDFMGQEPGSDTEILDFCQINFGVSFPLMARSVVRGEGLHPLYDYLTTASTRPGAIGWNFTKFLIGPDGQVIERFGPRTVPADIRPHIDQALAHTTGTPTVLTE